jgi:hypothetical protein
MTFTHAGAEGRVVKAALALLLLLSSCFCTTLTGRVWPLELARTPQQQHDAWLYLQQPLKLSITDLHQLLAHPEAVGGRRLAQAPPAAAAAGSAAPPLCSATINYGASVGDTSKRSTAEVPIFVGSFDIVVSTAQQRQAGYGAVPLQQLRSRPEVKHACMRTLGGNLTNCRNM